MFERSPPRHESRMTARPDVAAERPPVRPPTIAIVGNDALLAARPASAVQLTHGLTRLGFDAVVPASWGDELVANACLERCARRDARPAVLCSCPLVAERLLATGTDLSAFLVPLVTPAVAVARYLRELAAPARPRITWIGGCPGAITDEIDERLTPDELFERLVDADIRLPQLPTVFESVLPADRRRTLSLPGGAPTGEVLRQLSPVRTLVELESLDLADELAQHLLSGDTVLVDPAPRLGCLCSGATSESLAGRTGRTAVMSIEPPRSATSAVDLAVRLDLDAPLPAPPAVARPVHPATAVGEPEHPPPPELAPLVRQRPGAPSRPAGAKPATPLPPGRSEPRSGGRLRSPALGVPRFQGGSPPVSRTGEGRALPRAYVARRRTPTSSRRVSGELPPDADTASTPAPESPAGRETHERPPAEGAPATATATPDEPHARFAVPSPTPPPSPAVAPDADTARPASVHATEPARGAEPSLAWLVREGPEAARVVPRYIPSPRARPRRTVLGVIGATVLIIAAAVATGRDGSGNRTADAASAPVDSAAGTIATEPSPASSASAAAARREGARQATAPAPRVSAPRSRSGQRTGAASPRTVPRLAAPPAPAAVAPAATTPPAAAAPPAAESTGTPATARTEQAAAAAVPARDTAGADRADELAEIRRELERRRARIDSISRAVEAMPRPATPPATP